MKKLFKVLFILIMFLCAVKFINIISNIYDVSNNETLIEKAISSVMATSGGRDQLKLWANDVANSSEKGSYETWGELIFDKAARNDLKTSSSKYYMDPVYGELTICRLTYLSNSAAVFLPKELEAVLLRENVRAKINIVVLPEKCVAIFINRKVIAINPRGYDIREVYGRKKIYGCDGVYAFSE